MPKSINYYDTFIEVAEDTKATTGIAPPVRGGKKSVANYEFEMISEKPYQYTSDDVAFYVYAQRNQLSKSSFKHEREVFFSKSRPCFRTSPLTKTYGWGVHSNETGRIAIYGVDSPEYTSFLQDDNTVKKKAMRSSKR